MSNSVDPDETAHIEPSHLDLRCLQKPVIIACGSERVKRLGDRLRQRGEHWGKSFSRRHFKIFSPENRFYHFMELVPLADNFHKMPNPIFWEKYEKNILNMSSAELAQTVVNVNFSKVYRMQRMCLSKRCWPRSDVVNYGIWSGSALVACHTAVSNKSTGSKMDLFED